MVTGAASGIGEQLAMQAQAKGAYVIASDVNFAGLKQAHLPSDNLVLHYLDVADARAIDDYAKEVSRTLGNRELILINNAGVGLISGNFLQTRLADLEWLVNINLWGAIRMTKAFYPYMFNQNAGHIVNISSVFGLAGFANQVAYCTAKFGLRGFSESLRMELETTGIYSTVVFPGGVKTNIMRSATPKGLGLTTDMHEKATATFERIALTTPEQAARQILTAIEKRQPRLVIGKDGLVIDLLTRMLPVRYTKIFLKKMNKTFKNR